MVRNKHVKYERIPAMDEPRMKSMLYKKEKRKNSSIHRKKKTFIQLFKGERPTSKHPYKT